MSTDSTPTVELDTIPQPLLAGTFAIYPTPEGGIVLVTDVEGRGIERRSIPAGVVKMLNGGGGPVGGMLRKMFGDSKDAL